MHRPSHDHCWNRAWSHGLQYLEPLTTIAGIVLGHMGFNTSKEMNGMGRNEAIGGLVMNYLSLAMYVIGVVFGAAILGGVGFGLS